MSKGIASTRQGSVIGLQRSRYTSGNSDWSATGKYQLGQDPSVPVVCLPAKGGEVTVNLQGEDLAQYSLELQSAGEASGTWTYCSDTCRKWRPSTNDRIGEWSLRISKNAAGGKPRREKAVVKVEFIADTEYVQEKETRVELLAKQMHSSNAQKDRTIENQCRQIRTKDRTISDQRQKLKVKSQTISDSERSLKQFRLQIQAKDRTISGQKTDLKNQSRKFDALKRQLRSKDQELRDVKERESRATAAHSSKVQQLESALRVAQQTNKMYEASCTVCTPFDQIHSSHTASNNGRTITATACQSGGQVSFVGSVLDGTGIRKLKYEFANIGGSYYRLGFVQQSQAPKFLGQTGASFSIGAIAGSYGYHYSGTKYNGSTSGQSYGSAWNNGTVEAVVDFRRGCISFSVNGVDQGVAFTGIKGPLLACVQLCCSGSATILQS